MKLSDKQLDWLFHQVLYIMLINVVSVGRAKSFVPFMRPAMSVVNSREPMREVCGVVRRHCQAESKYGQVWSNMVKYGQAWAVLAQRLFVLRAEYRPLPLFNGQYSWL